MDEFSILCRIDQLLQKPAIAAQINEIVQRVEAKFSGSGEPLAWETIPLKIYGNDLPEMLRSSWVFLLRQDAISGAERHPNSHQRVMSWRGKGDLQVWNNDQWESHILIDDFNVPVENRWVSIPINMWHQAAVEPGEHWIVVSFHTATAEELIEERPDPSDKNLTRQKIYTRVHS
jgi:hypothetical protein